MSTDTQTHAANGTHTTNGIPHGSTSLTPHIVVSPAEQALEFYATVFGAHIVDVTRFGDIVAHAVVDFGNGMLTLSDPMEANALIPVDPALGHDYSLALYCPNVDAVTSAARAHGAMVREEPASFVSGDRFSSILDPFGIRWSVMTRVEDLSPAESAERVAEWARSQG
ncbi:VOC family protein [Paramicrobacterium chengjingii]|uniref:VOC family protein n=1 Tax=Paramicrobacterium chengjingii TaxID=2769067 RepID=A0ABX6YFV0_9MICO|nr:VOC family protein [Microbacterium chengjingii]QPZ37661.1 VOC family protein [Microbacterium chengjingii]